MQLQDGAWKDASLSSLAGPADIIGMTYTPTSKWPTWWYCDGEVSWHDVLRGYKGFGELATIRLILLAPYFS